MLDEGLADTNAAESVRYVVLISRRKLALKSCTQELVCGFVVDGARRIFANEPEHPR
jgi:hypothetical protein